MTLVASVFLPDLRITSAELSPAPVPLVVIQANQCSGPPPPKRSGSVGAVFSIISLEVCSAWPAAVPWYGIIAAGQAGKASVGQLETNLIAAFKIQDRSRFGRRSYVKAKVL